MTYVIGNLDFMSLVLALPVPRCLAKAGPTAFASDQWVTFMRVFSEARVLVTS
jgi:hypothetical protein